MKRNLIISVLGTAGLISLFYYMIKFCSIMNRTEFMCWIIVSVIIIITIVIGIVNTFKLNKVQKQLSCLTEIIKVEREIIEKYHYDELSAIENNLESILDLDRK